MTRRRAPVGVRCVATLLLPAAAALPLRGSAAPAVPEPPSAPADRHPVDTVDVHVRKIFRTGDTTVTFPTFGDPDRPLVVLDPRLRERIVAMAERSTRWLEGLLTLRTRRFPVLVGSVVQLEEELPTLKRFRYDGAAGAWIFSDRHGRPMAAAVAVNLPKLVVRNRVLGGDPERLDRMIELHLAHEIYGHVVPVAASADLTHPCVSDPPPGAAPELQAQSCVMEREAEVLVDLGYEPRESYRWSYWEEAVGPIGDRERGSRPD